MFTVTIKTDNAAFGDHTVNEVARILREVADRIETDGDERRDGLTLRDVNGNTVGRAGFGR